MVVVDPVVVVAKVWVLVAVVGVVVVVDAVSVVVKVVISQPLLTKQIVDVVVTPMFPRVANEPFTVKNIATRYTRAETASAYAKILFNSSSPRIEELI